MREALRGRETTAPTHPRPGGEALGDTPLLLPQRVCCRNHPPNLLNQTGWVRVPGGGASAPNKEPEAGEAARYGHAAKGKGLSTVGAGRCPRPGALEEAEPPLEAGEGPGPHPAHPPDSGKTGSALAGGSPGGQAPQLPRRGPRFPQPPHPPREGSSLFLQPCPALVPFVHQADF